MVRVCRCGRDRPVAPSLRASCRGHRDSKKKFGQLRSWKKHTHRLRGSAAMPPLTCVLRTYRNQLIPERARSLVRILLHTGHAAGFWIRKVFFVCSAGHTASCFQRVTPSARAGLQPASCDVLRRTRSMWPDQPDQPGYPVTRCGASSHAAGGPLKPAEASYCHGLRLVFVPPHEQISSTTRRDRACC